MELCYNTISFFVSGILLLFFGRPKLGLLIELFGLLNLFGCAS